jgi:signal recognition particle receptor subunit beta
VSTVNALAREIAAKIVYYGPGLSGKTTSLKQIYASVRPESRGELISLSTEGDRTLFFDFLPLRIEQVRGLNLRLQLYTVPGQVFYDATRKLVLNGADGVIFVADSQNSARDSNLESMRNLADNLNELGIDVRTFPCVVQYNKRDLLDVMPVSQMRAELNLYGAPDLETIAARGDGILPGLKEITRLVIRDLKARQPVRRPTPPPPEAPTKATDLASELSAAAEASQLPSPEDRAALVELSFARLFPGNAASIADVELAIRERTFGTAVRAAAQAVSELLEVLPAYETAPRTRAALLGLDGQEYLRLCRLAGKPDAGLTEQDALFALYLLIAARVKSDRI